MDSSVTDELKQAKRYRQKEILSKIVVFIFLLILFLWSISGIEYPGIATNGIEVAGNIIKGILQPSLDLLFNFTSSGIPYLIFETIAIAFLGTIFGAIISLPLAFLCASNITGRFMNALGIALITGIRSIPALVYGIIFVKVVGPNAFAGVLTFSVTSIGMITKLYIEAIEEMDYGIIEAMDASGISGFRKIRIGVLPQVIVNFISTVIYRFEINVKDAAILGIIGAGGIGTPLIFAISYSRWNDVGAFLLALIVLVLVVEFASNKIRSKMV